MVHKEPYEALQAHMGPYRTIQDHMDSYLVIRDDKRQCETIKVLNLGKVDHTVPYGAKWDHTGP